MQITRSQATKVGFALFFAFVACSVSTQAHAQAAGVRVLEEVGGALRAGEGAQGAGKALNGARGIPPKKGGANPGALAPTAGELQEGLDGFNAAAKKKAAPAVVKKPAPAKAPAPHAVSKPAAPVVKKPAPQVAPKPVAKPTQPAKPVMEQGLDNVICDGGPGACTLRPKPVAADGTIPANTDPANALAGTAQELSVPLDFQYDPNFKPVADGDGLSEYVQYIQGTGNKPSTIKLSRKALENLKKRCPPGSKNCAEDMQKVACCEVCGNPVVPPRCVPVCEAMNIKPGAADVKPAAGAPVNHN